MVEEVDTKPATVVEVLGPWLLNKGDVLNLHAVAEAVGDRHRLAVSSKLGRDELPGEPELYEVKWKPTFKELGNAVNALSLQRTFWWLRDRTALNVLPNSVLESNGYVDGRGISLLLDCSGYAYGDKWSVHRIDKREAYYRRLKQHDTLVIMLPQALGPFENPAIRESSAALFEHFDIMYARDEVSRKYVADLGVPPERLKIAPDITHLLQGTPPQNKKEWASRVCVVPNARMFDRTSPETSDAYLDFLLRSIRQFRDNDLEPFLLIHEKNDLPLGEKIQGLLDFPIRLIDEDAIVSKGILGCCYAVMSSRYHALISSLSQGTPAMGTTWAHKYDALFEDYGCSEFLVSPLDDPDTLAATIDDFITLDKRNTLRDRLQDTAEKQKEKVQHMWEHIEGMLAERVY